MLKIVVPETEQWDESKQLFVYTKEQTLYLEHSLVSISKWESKWCKAFLTEDHKSKEEILDYVKCMTLTQNVDPNVYTCLTQDNYSQITEYIESPMTATVFFEEKTHSKKETITSELIYYWMILFNIPFECQKWHIHRLITLIKICTIKNSTPKKMNKRDIMNRNAALNSARRKKLNTKG